MGKLKINGTTEFMGIQLPIIEGGFGEDKKCVLAKDIAGIHNKELKHINEAINKNRFKFRDKIDIMNLLDIDIEDSFLKKLGFTQQAINSHRGAKTKGLNSSIYLLSETGYAILLNMLEEFDIQLVQKLYKQYFKSDYFTFINTYKRSENIFFSLIEPTIDKLGLSIKRQYHINNKRLDGYIPELNLVIEYDENDHLHYNQIEEYDRQNMIKETLGCDFIRVSDRYDYGEAISRVIKEIINKMGLRCCNSIQ